MSVCKVDVPRHIYWSSRNKVTIDESDPRQKKWLLGQILSNGTISDIRKLDLDEVEQALPSLNLPLNIRVLWRDYFEWRHSNSVS